MVKVIKLTWFVTSGLQKAWFWRALRNRCCVNRRLRNDYSFGALTHPFETW